MSGEVVGKVHSIQIGRAAPLGPEGTVSGFVKNPVATAVEVGELGIVGDEQADLRVHGGPDKAVYGYALEHYSTWRAEFPQHAMLLVPGGLGENLTLETCSEADVCVHDVVQIGTAMFQVTQPRQPCFKFALRFDDVAMPRAMIRNGYSGWYYRVLESGRLQAGDVVRLTQRFIPRWPIERVNRLIVQRRATAAERDEFMDMLKQTRMSAGEK